MAETPDPIDNSSNSAPATPSAITSSTANAPSQPTAIGGGGSGSAPAATPAAVGVISVPVAPSSPAAIVQNVASGSPATPSTVNPLPLPPINSTQQNQLDAHVARVDNPHGVTADQVGAMPKVGVAGYKIVAKNYALTNDDLGHVVQPTNVADASISVSGVSINGTVTIAAPNDHPMTLTHATGMADQHGNIMVSYVLPAYAVAIIGYANGGCSIINAMPKSLHLNMLTAENQSLANGKSVTNLSQNKGLFASLTNVMRNIDLSLLTDRSFGGGSLGSLNQLGRRMNNGTTAGGMAMVTYNGILGYGGQNGNNKFNVEYYPFTLFWSTNYNVGGGTRMRIMLGQDDANITTPFPDDGSKSGIIVEIESVTSYPHHARFRLGVAKSGSMHWTDWAYGGNDEPATLNKGYSYKNYPCSFALSIKSDQVKLTCIAHNSLREGFTIVHPQTPAPLADTYLGVNTANLQITNEHHNAAGNVPLFLEQLQYQNHAF